MILKLHIVIQFGTVYSFEPSWLPKYNESCVSLDESALCEHSCATNLTACVNSCSDDACLTGCKRDAFVCLDACPCHPGCPLGCDGCDHWACEKCGEPETQLHVEQCTTFAAEHREQCETKCQGEANCVQLCTIEFTRELDYCPCSIQCPGKINRKYNWTNHLLDKLFRWMSLFRLVLSKTLYFW